VLTNGDVRDELLYDAVRQLSLRCLMSRWLPTGRQIGLQEVAALAALVRRLARDPRCWNRRVIVIVDARVIRRAVTRGRSSSRTLNRALRRLAAHHLLSGIQLLVIWVPTDVNVADDPTRHKTVRDPAARSRDVEEALLRFAAAHPHVLEVLRASGSAPVAAAPATVTRPSGNALLGTLSAARRHLPVRRRHACSAPAPLLPRIVPLQPCQRDPASADNPTYYELPRPMA
jgi:hypothetical protein